jgi:CDP-paratose 2-epimerase
MSVAVITGSAGLIGSEAARHFAALGMDVVGLDNDMRRAFFGEEASTAPVLESLRLKLGSSYQHFQLDVRNREGVEDIFTRYGAAISLVVHSAAQPSHDWAARDPLTDFDINAVGTLNVLEATRLHSPEAVFIFTSTNKVYGDRPNALPFVEMEARYEIEPGHTYAGGIREDMSIDRCLHSLFGASKVAADILVQEYGRYFQIPTACFRGGTLTGPQHSATQLHGFLAYVIRCAMMRAAYTVFGYKGKQVRDIIHSADLVRAFDQFFRRPRVAEVYNIGGGRMSNASVLEAISLAQKITGEELSWSYEERNRVGDHVWWIGDNSKFQEHYPAWRMEYDLERIAKEIHELNQERWTP